MRDENRSGRSCYVTGNNCRAGRESLWLPSIFSENMVLQARKLAYGDKQVVADGPLPREFQPEGERFVIRFDGLGGGLVATEGRLKSFEILDAAGAWHPALAEIKGDSVTVRAAGVPNPTGVRYAWLGFPEVTLFNKEGLPATPFQYPPADLQTGTCPCMASNRGARSCPMSMASAGARK
jgi:hypothetical protein